jgi:Protein of unknown function (DUF2628)
MASYIVMERRAAAGRLPDTVFVRDEFSFLALFLPVVWLLWHRLWFAAVMMIIISTGLALTGEWLGGAAVITLAGLALGIFVALEGPAWRIAQYRREGFAERAALQAASLQEAEIRWFVHPGEEAAATPPLMVSATSRADARPDMLFGFSDGAGR